MNLRNTSRKICTTQIKLGKQILRTKTRKAAMKLLRNVPYMKTGNIQKGLRWWEYIQSVPEKERSKTINTSAKPMLEACIKKYSHPT
jgi:hypothetical protein